MSMTTRDELQRQCFKVQSGQGCKKVKWYASSSEVPREVGILRLQHVCNDCFDVLWVFHLAFSGLIYAYTGNPSLP